MNLEALKASRVAKIKEAKAAVADPAKYDALMAEITDLDGQITEAQEQEKLAAKRRAQCAAWEKELEVLNPRQTTPDPITQTLTAPAIPKQHKRPFRSFGEQLQCIHRAGTGQAPDPRLFDYENLAPSGAAEANPTDGGFLVQTDFATEIFNRVYQFGQIASRVRRVQIGPNSNGLIMNAVSESSRADGSRYGGVQAYWGNEGVAATAKKPQFRRMEIPLHKLLGLMYATDELLTDATALTSIANQAFTEEFQFFVENAALRGDGTGKLNGVIGHNATVSVAKETGQAAATITLENIQKMFARCWAPSFPNAIWMINQDCLPQLMGMSQVIGTGGVPVFLPPGGVSQAPWGTLFGRPVVPLEYCSTVGTVGDIVLGDWSQYMLIEKGGVEFASSMHVLFTTAEQTFRVVYRVGGQPLWQAKLTPANGSNTLAPFVTLATRA